MHSGLSRLGIHPRQGDDISKEKVLHRCELAHISFVMNHISRKPKFEC